MVSISHETPAQTHARLRSVISQSQFTILDGVWSFVETPISQPPQLNAETLAVVRDEESWSALTRDDGRSGPREQFGLVSFHFPPGLDNSGFVGWLATELKTRLGTGLFVVCGSNRDHGGIYDYWGCPAELLDDVVIVIRELSDTSVTPS